MRKLKKFAARVAFLAAWMLLFFFVYKLSQIEPSAPTFDPFAELEIEKDASPAEVRKAYKQLSLKFHPDKGGDPVRFIQISKAYAALTNDESRRNWQEYGNPDGPGAASFGIALPKWVIEKENFYLVLGAYVLLFMVVLPIGVGTWWYNTVKFSNTKVLLITVRYFCGTFMRSPYMALPRVIKVLSNAYEYNPQFNKEIKCRPSDNIELPPLIMQIPIFTIFKKAIVGAPYSVKARALIHAHLERLELPQKTLLVDQHYILKQAPRLINEMTKSLLYVLAIAMEESGGRMKSPQHLATLENCMRLLPMLIQGLTDNASALLQLPHIGQTQLRHMASRQRNVKSVRQLAGLPDDKRRALLRSLSDEQYRDVLTVFAMMPHLELSYRCEVSDEEDNSIWPFSMVTTTINLARQALLTMTSSTSNSATGVGSLIVPINSAPSPDGQPSSNGGLWYSGNSNRDNPYDHSPAHLYPTPDCSLAPGRKAYGDFVDDFDDDLQDPSAKKPNSMVWDKSKRKKGGRKAKVRKEQARLQQHNRLRQQNTKQIATTELDSDLAFPTDTVTTHSMPTDAEPSELVKQRTEQESDGEGDVDEQGLTDEVEPDAEKAAQRVCADSNKRNTRQCDKVQCTHQVHCPYFPAEKFEGWWIYLVDRRTRHLITTPVYVNYLQNQEEVQLRFVAPAQPGQYLYSLCVRSDSYVDFDFIETVRFTVHPLPDRVLRYLQEEERRAGSSTSSDEDDDVSDYDETDETELEVGKRPESPVTKTSTTKLADIEDDDDEEGYQGHQIDEERLSVYIAKS